MTWSIPSVTGYTIAAAHHRRGDIGPVQGHHEEFGRDDPGGLQDAFQRHLQRIALGFPVVADDRIGAGDVLRRALQLQELERILPGVVEVLPRAPVQVGFIVRETVQFIGVVQFAEQELRAAPDKGVEHLGGIGPVDRRRQDDLQRLPGRLQLRLQQAHGLFVILDPVRLVRVETAERSRERRPEQSVPFAHDQANPRLVLREAEILHRIALVLVQLREIHRIEHVLRMREKLPVLPGLDNIYLHATYSR